MTVGGRALRSAAQRLTTGVTVLTTGRGEALHGTTVSAVGLVGRRPPIVSAGLRAGSTFIAMAVANGRFAVNVLAARQSVLADWFADPARPPGRAQFALLDWAPDQATGLPLLARTLSILVCEVRDRVPAGDHELLLGEVTDSRDGGGSPLLSFGGGLHGAELRDVARARGGAADACLTTID